MHRNIESRETHSNIIIQNEPLFLPQIKKYFVRKITRISFFSVLILQMTKSLRWARWKVGYIPIKPRDLPSFLMADEEEARRGSWEFQQRAPQCSALPVNQDGGLLKSGTAPQNTFFALQVKLII